LVGSKGIEIGHHLINEGIVSDRSSGGGGGDGGLSGGGDGGLSCGLSGSIMENVALVKLIKKRIFLVICAFNISKLSKVVFLTLIFSLFFFLDIFNKYIRYIV
jgi:hypothetical protein